MSDVKFRPADVDALVRRAGLYRLIRAFFDERGFVETTTPTLSRDVVVDRFVHSIPVNVEKCWIEPDVFSERRFSAREKSRQEATTFYLQTSPEFAMKRLIASGMSAIYQICPAFRLGDRGTLHNVEFSMLEWYRVGDDYETGRAFLAEFVSTIAARFRTEAGEPPLDWAREIVQRPFGALFCEKTGLDPHFCSVSDLLALCDARSIPYPESYADPNGSATKDDLLDLVFSELVQPNLEDATIVYDYPASQSQLAKTSEVLDPRTGKRALVSRRFELFARGIELANGYDELRDPGVLRARIAETSRERLADGSPELPAESRLLAAMDSGFPQCSGCALGVDRLLLVLTGKERIDETLAFPIELA